ncbi:chitin synthase, putative [Talaromyces stipitatus ATCC 10500]|uniref:chitin synthase n=1 Tax=Talaromyces stipitatus (strain ATCC 10500 / CBS 375.48 / QM 6759 / NRRL 1006) TaxID=441959 RepID=B8LXE6_TALSN|nr:chitin synthase, putative [Talaromyces stipitatus ATCC 10500]EED23227.1 chitin synthase, putative [Talaromyces stipitatus ATCC 10500]
MASVGDTPQVLHMPEDTSDETDTSKEIKKYPLASTSSRDPEDQSKSPIVPQQHDHLSEKRTLRRELWIKRKKSQKATLKIKTNQTDERIRPGKYRRFWAFKMKDFRLRLAFRQKLLFCLLIGVVYVLLSYFLIVQPVFSCVMKVHLGMFSGHGNFCSIVRHIVWIYMGVGGGFMLLTAFCAVKTRYASRSFEEHDTLIIMHVPCYNENEYVLRKTIDSCVASTYAKKRKLLFIVADGKVAAPGHKPTYQILLYDIFNHKADLESGIDAEARHYSSFDENGTSDNYAFCCTGYFREVPYVVVVKVGRADEQRNPKPGNRNKRDSQLLVYNFLYYVNYHQEGGKESAPPLFETIDFQMCMRLNMDARHAMYMLVADSDTEIEPTGISYLVHQLEKDQKLIGVCGYTGVSNPVDSFVACSQVFEYWLTHAILKALESVCSNVLVLSGCFTIYRLKWPENNKPAILYSAILEDYSGNYEKTLHEHNLLSIGEDRYLSTLSIRYFGSQCRQRYFSAAVCTTTAPASLSVLIDQRRRWTNSLIHCRFSHLSILPFEASFWTQLMLVLMIGSELFMVLILPLALPAGFVLAAINLFLSPLAWPILLAFCLIPIALCILCNDWRYIPFYIPFFP